MGGVKVVFVVVVVVVFKFLYLKKMSRFKM